MIHYRCARTLLRARQHDRSSAKKSGHGRLRARSSINTPTDYWRFVPELLLDPFPLVLEPALPEVLPALFAPDVPDPEVPIRSVLEPLLLEPLPLLDPDDPLDPRSPPAPPAPLESMS